MEEQLESEEEPESEDRVAEALDAIREHAKTSNEPIYNVYALDKVEKLLGLASLRELIIASPGDKLADIMRENVITVPPVVYPVPESWVMFDVAVGALVPSSVFTVAGVVNELLCKMAFRMLPAVV